MRPAVPLAAAALLLTGCGGNTRAAATFPNPVTIIQKTGCTPAPGVTNGELGFGGDFMVASCDFPSGDSLTVKTFKTAAAKVSELAASQRQDGQATIVGADWVMYVSSGHDSATGGPAAFYPAPAVLASATGGKVQ